MSTTLKQNLNSASLIQIQEMNWALKLNIKNSVLNGAQAYLTAERSTQDCITMISETFFYFTSVPAYLFIVKVSNQQHPELFIYYFPSAVCFPRVFIETSSAL